MIDTNLNAEIIFPWMLLNKTQVKVGNYFNSFQTVPLVKKLIRRFPFWNISLFPQCIDSYIYHDVLGNCRFTGDDQGGQRENKATVVFD